MADVKPKPTKLQLAYLRARISGQYGEVLGLTGSALGRVVNNCIAHGWITEFAGHGSDAESFQITDEGRIAAGEPVVRNAPIPAAPAIGVEDAVGNPLHEGDAVEVLGDEGRMYAVAHADPEGRGLWIYPLGVSNGANRQVSPVEVHKQVFENVDGVVKYVPATPAAVEVDDDEDGWGQPDGMLGVTEAERAAVEEINAAAIRLEGARRIGVDVEQQARRVHDLMRPYFAGLLVEAMALGIEQGAIMPETGHTTRIEAPPSTSGHWEASCTGCHVGGTGYEDPIEAVTAALAHGPLAGDVGTVLANIEPDEETLGDLETITELAALIVAGPRSAMVEQTLKDTLDAIGGGKPIG